MRAYVLTTAIVFALILAGHVWRVAAEGTHVLGEPIFAFSTLLAIGLVGWAAKLLLRRPD